MARGPVFSVSLSYGIGKGMVDMDTSLTRTGFGQTARRDEWWLQPAVVFLVLSSFVAYATWAAFQGTHYTFGPYLSPFYSPELFGDSPHSLFGPKPSGWPTWLPFSPALLILGLPAGFRLTCYYYRGAYYKAFWADPPSCTVGELRKRYRGERSLPLVLQNVHRLFLYAALVFLVFLAHDVWGAMWFADPGTGQAKFGIRLGTDVLNGRLVRLENLLMAQYLTHEHQALIIGAGGAGLRAAIEASAAGVSVGLVCKSLLGKAHTVMAEGGIAAALANTDERDNWKVHFADTTRGGQYVNNWRMAELHAKEAPARVRELEAWGALFDRTKDGRILQRNFGGHRYPRLAHVGDRTGLEMIRTLQDQGVHRGLDVHMEFTVVSLLLTDGRASGVVGYERERGRFKAFNAGAVVLATGGTGRAYKITSNSWEGTGDGHALAYQAGAELMDMEFIQFHPTGMIWPPSVQGILVTEGVRGEGGILLNKEGRRFMFDDIPEPYRNQTADNEDEGWRYTQGDKSARRPPELLTRDHVARCIMREVKAGRGSPHGGVFLDIAWIKKRLSGAEAHIKRKLPSMYHQFKELGDIDITAEPM